MGVATRVFYESIFSSDKGFDSSGPLEVFPHPAFAASSAHSFLSCWQSHTVTSHLPSGPLPWALPGPEGAVQGLRLCAGCRTQGTLGTPIPTPTPLGSTGASAPFDCKNVSSAMPLPPLPRADCPGTGANQTGHQGHSRKANSLPVASPSTLGDQIYLMVKGLAGSGSQNIQGLGPPCALVPLLGLGPRVAELHHPLIASSLPSTWMLLRENKVLFFPSYSKCSSCGFSQPCPWSHA